MRPGELWDAPALFEMRSLPVWVLGVAGHCPTPCVSAPGQLASLFCSSALGLFPEQSRGAWAGVCCFLSLQFSFKEFRVRLSYELYKPAWGDDPGV